MDVNNNRANENWNHMYGIGPDDKKWKDIPKEHLKNSMRRKFRIENDDIELRKMSEILQSCYSYGTI